MPIIPLEQRFWSKVRRGDGCWIWTAATNGKYGRLNLKPSNTTLYAHRASWVIHFGPIPDGLFVLHRCDVPLCVRPDHLFLGTQAENQADMVKKGRSGRGERSGKSKLMESDILKIRQLHAEGLSLREIAAIVGTTKSNIGHIVLRDSWTHLK